MPRPNPYKCKYVCYMCNYGAYQVDPMRAHICAHSGEKPFKCSHCSFACARHSNLLVHIKAKHWMIYRKLNVKKFNLNVIFLEKFTISFSSWPHLVVVTFDRITLSTSQKDHSWFKATNYRNKSVHFFQVARRYYQFKKYRIGFW